ncbi:unnamed protein product [Phytophthora lilii]|uniref:Unnamed protein product n=1 Tax=Phytophthora lilii TaxID=2077276 RepID=A0A9W6TFN8_9STRA|nr:unnamed protein product [Phytophthora lilii]
MPAAYPAPPTKASISYYSITHQHTPATRTSTSAFHPTALQRRQAPTRWQDELDVRHVLGDAAEHVCPAVRRVPESMEEKHHGARVLAVVDDGVPLVDDHFTRIDAGDDDRS